MKYSRDGFVSYITSCEKLNTRYMWGAIGRPITLGFIKEKSQEYPSYYSVEKVQELESLVGKNFYGFDCSGLIKSYFMGGFSAFKCDNNRDKNSQMMFDQAQMKGRIDTIPEEPGICVYMQGHVGVYVGNGLVVECTANPEYGNGVVRTSLDGRGWTHWFELNWMIPDKVRTPNASIKLKRLAQKARTLSKYSSEILTLNHAPKWKYPFCCMDILGSFILGFSPGEYMAYQFYRKPWRKRKTYWSNRNNVKFVYTLNKIENMWILRDKSILLSRLDKQLKRDYLIMESTDLEMFSEFCNKHKQFVVKFRRSTYGLGMEVYRDFLSPEEVKELYQRLSKENKYIVEEYVLQHPVINRVYSGSVNTIRMHTLRTGGGIQNIPITTMRFGSGAAKIDFENGITVKVNSETGELCSDGLLGDIFLMKRHPDSNIAFRGFQIPLFQEAKRLVCEAAELIPELSYIGWDVAISETGPVIIEGNGASAVYATYQALNQMENGGQGSKAEFLAIQKIWAE